MRHVIAWKAIAAGPGSGLVLLYRNKVGGRRAVARAVTYPFVMRMLSLSVERSTGASVRDRVFSQTSCTSFQNQVLVVCGGPGPLRWGETAPPLAPFACRFLIFQPLWG